MTSSTPIIYELFIILSIVILSIVDIVIVFVTKYDVLLEYN